jgi:PAS domain S-box-containing protein
MGIILNVTKNITKVFGYTKEAIVGQNINEIMPKSMQKEHDAILNSWRERASWENIHTTRFIFAMTRDNVCF